MSKKTNMNIRKIFFEMAIIIATAAGLGIFYNFFAAPKPLSWIYIPRHIDQASDSALFAPPPMPQPDSSKQLPVAAVTELSARPQRDSANKAQPKAAINRPIAETTERVPIAASAQQQTKPLEVKYEQVLRLSKDTDVLFLDARAENEYNEGHIPGAKLLTALEFEKHIPEIIGLPRDKRIVVYCGGGLCELSHQLCDNLIAFGFNRVFIYLGGWEDWKQKQKQ